ncbi:type VI protein secretion system component VasK [Sporosarcina luteola]|nr:type VI protein secretion system component VasK [Sporosarcina luteola]
MDPMLIILLILVGLSLVCILSFMQYARRLVANSPSKASQSGSTEKHLETIIKQNEEIIALLKERNTK